MAWTVSCWHLTKFELLWGFLSLGILLLRPFLQCKFVEYYIILLYYGWCEVLAIFTDLIYVHVDVDYLEEYWSLEGVRTNKSFFGEAYFVIRNYVRAILI